MLKKVLTVAVAMSVLMAGALPAFAEEHEDETVAEDGPAFIYDGVEQVLLFEVEGKCTLDAEVDIEFMVDEEGDITFGVVMDESDAPTTDFSIVDSDADTIVEDPMAGCEPFSVEGPNGQVNHGTFVSNLMHFLKDQGIKGSDKKEFKQALKGFGKGDDQVKAKDDENTIGEGDLDEDETSEELKVKPAKAEKSQKDKKDKNDKKDKSNRGRNK